MNKCPLAGRSMPRRWVLCLCWGREVGRRGSESVPPRKPRSGEPRHHRRASGGFSTHEIGRREFTPRPREFLDHLGDSRCSRISYRSPNSIGMYTCTYSYMCEYVHTHSHTRPSTRDMCHAMPFRFPLTITDRQMDDWLFSIRCTGRRGNEWQNSLSLFQTLISDFIFSPFSCFFFFSFWMVIVIGMICILVSRK